MLAACSGMEVAAGAAAVGLSGGAPAFLRCGAKRKEEEGEAEEDERGEKRIHGFFLGDDDEERQQQPSESSSIGVPSSSSSEEHKGGGEDEEEEVQSKEGSGGGLGSFDYVEESLPIKRGLSSHFAGKSKSFASLSDAAAFSAGAKGLAKPENPINKRRRLLLASSRRASFCSLAMISPPPVLISPEHTVEEEP